MSVGLESLGHFLYVTGTRSAAFQVFFLGRGHSPGETALLTQLKLFAFSVLALLLGAGAAAVAANLAATPIGTVAVGDSPFALALAANNR